MQSHESAKCIDISGRPNLKHFVHIFCVLNLIDIKNQTTLTFCSDCAFYMFTISRSHNLPIYISYVSYIFYIYLFRMFQCRMCDLGDHFEPFFSPSSDQTAIMYWQNRFLFRSPPSTFLFYFRTLEWCTEMSYVDFVPWRPFVLIRFFSIQFCNVFSSSKEPISIPRLYLMYDSKLNSRLNFTVW